MRVLLINKSHKIIGGADTVYFNTADLLREEGHSVAFFSVRDIDNLYTEFSTYFPSKIELDVTGVFNKIRFVKNYLYNKEAADKLRELLVDFEPDIIHIHLFYGVLSSSILDVIKASKVPCVMTVHDYKLICPVSTMLDSSGSVCHRCFNGNYTYCTINKCYSRSFPESIILMVEAFYRGTFKNPLNYIDHFIFVSEFSRNLHINWKSEMCSKSSRIYNFVNEPIFSREGSEESDLFLYFGRLSREKGLINLIRVFKKSNRNLKIVGSGPLQSVLKDLVSQCSNIELIPHVGQKEIEYLIVKAKFVVIPSEWYENNPMSVLESFSLGVPVIGSRIGGIPELIVEGYNGFLFEPGSSSDLNKVIEKALAISKDDYDAMSSNAKSTYYLKFNRDIHLKDLLGVYNNLVNI